MLEIARRRRQDGSCVARSARPDATSRAALMSAIERLGARPQASSSAGAQRPAARRWAGCEAAAGAAASPGGAPSSARWLRRGGSSISCSQTAQARASKGSGRRRGRSQGRRRITGPISGSRRKRRWNSARSWSVPSAKRIRSIAAAAISRECGASARRRTRPPAAQARTTAGLVAEVQRPHQRAAVAHAGRRRGRRGQAVGPGGRHVLLEHGAAGDPARPLERGGSIGP